MKDETKMATDETLVFVQIVFRHGSRTPATSFPNDAYKDSQFKPFGKGQLTQKGRQEAYELGKTIREMYDDFLGDAYDPDEVHSVTSGFARTEMTLQCVHASLFPARKSAQLEEGLTWQPILYDVLSKKGDKYLGVHRYDNSLLDVEREIDAETRKVYDYVGQLAGSRIMSKHGYFKVQNALHVQQEMGLEIPNWGKSLPDDFTRDFWEEMSSVRLPQVGGPLVGLLTENLINKKEHAQGFLERKMCLLSGHDMNIVCLLGAFNSYKRELIRYCAFVAIELHKIKGDYYVQIIYQNGTDKSTRKTLNILPGTTDECLCSLDAFVAHTRHLYK